MFSGRRTGLSGWRRNVSWKEDFEARALPQRGMNQNVAAGLTDDAVDGGEAEASAFAGRLRGEKGFKDLRASFFIHACAAIGDFENNPKRMGSSVTVLVR